MLKVGVCKKHRWEPNMKLKYVSWIPAFLLMCIIFNFSSETAVESVGSSLQIANAVIDIYDKITDNAIDISQKPEILLQVDHLVRKFAHGLEYAVLAAFLAFHLWILGWRRWKLFLTSILISGVYAGTDEFHQLFVVGRGCQITDVLIDITGAVIGAVCCITFLILRNKISRKSRN
jgi:VanZ family protein